MGRLGGQLQAVHQGLKTSAGGQRELVWVARSIDVRKEALGYGSLHEPAKEIARRSRRSC